MKYPYSNPNLRIRDLFAAMLLSKKNADNKLVRYFAQITGKNYILVTNSCRTALFLAWKVVGKKGEVITSPLTCKVAIDPVSESGNIPVFADIDFSDLNISVDDIPGRIGDDTIGIQVIHLGGNGCNMDAILKIANEKKLFVVEDCAQALGAKYKDMFVGSFGDISCFSLIKNAYGIGGGILATNDRAIFEKAREINNQFKHNSLQLDLFRIARHVLETRGSGPVSKLLTNLLTRLKKGRTRYKSVTGQLNQISTVEKKIAAYQISRFPVLHQKRAELGKEYFYLLTKWNLIINKDFKPDHSSFTKFFAYHPGILTHHHLDILKKKGIEVMHLEQKLGSPYQERLVNSEDAKRNGLPIYDKVHDHLISLPLCESFTKEDLKYIVSQLRTFLQ